MLKQFIGELKIGLFVSHANVVKTYGIFHDSTFIYVLMEYMEDGSLYRLVRNGCQMDEDEATSKLLEVCHAVHYLHSLNIIHRDIKPENIVVSNVCISIFREYVSFAILGGRSVANNVERPTAEH
jgi:aurora kinase